LGRLRPKAATDALRITVRCQLSSCVHGKGSELDGTAHKDDKTEKSHVYWCGATENIASMRNTIAQCDSVRARATHLEHCKQGVHVDAIWLNGSKAHWLDVGKGQKARVALRRALGTAQG
jgi:hypothetical protein